MRILAAIFVTLCVARSAPAEEPPSPWQVEGRASIGPSYDTNAARESAGNGVVADEAMVLLGGVDASWRGLEGHLTTLSWDGGAKVFESERGQDQLINQVIAGHTLRLAPWLVGSGELRGKDRRSRDHEREYTDLAGTAAIDLATLPLVPRLHGGFRSFQARGPLDAEDASFEGPFGGVTLRLRPFSRHVASAGYELAARFFPEGRNGIEDRNALVHLGQLGWTWRSKIVLGGGYLLAVTDGNELGTDSLRHRFHALLGTKLPGELFLNVQAALQLLSFPDGIATSTRTRLELDEDESLSSVTAKLSRPIGVGLSVEARYQLHAATFTAPGLSFERHEAGMALAWRF